MNFGETCQSVAYVTWGISYELLKLGGSILNNTAKDIYALPSQVARSQNMQEGAQKITAVALDVAGLGVTFMSPSLATSAAFVTGLLFVPALVGCYLYPEAPTERLNPEFVNCTRTKVTLSLASVASSFFLKSRTPIAAVTGGFCFSRVLLNQRRAIEMKEALAKQPKYRRFNRWLDTIK
jgi:hypothetical protein